MSGTGNTLYIPNVIIHSALIMVSILPPNVRTSTNRERRDQRIAKMFIIIVILFFICNTPRMVLNTSEVGTLNLLLQDVSKNVLFLEICPYPFCASTICYCHKCLPSQVIVLASGYEFSEGWPDW